MDLWLLRKKVHEFGGYDAVRLLVYIYRSFFFICFMFLKLTLFFLWYVGHKGKEMGRLGPLFGLHWNFWSLYAD